MMETTAWVVRSNERAIWVTLQPRSACGSCRSSGCTSAVLAQLFGSHPVELQLANPLAVRVGEQVVVGFPEQLLLSAALWIYLLPALAMIATVAGGSAAGSSEAVQVLLAIAGLLCGLLLVRLSTVGRAVRQRYAPRLLRPASTLPAPLVMKNSQQE